MQKVFVKLVVSRGRDRVGATRRCFYSAIFCCTRPTVHEVVSSSAFSCQHLLECRTLPEPGEEVISKHDEDLTQRRVWTSKRHRGVVWGEQWRGQWAWRRWHWERVVRIEAREAVEEK